VSEEDEKKSKPIEEEAEQSPSEGNEDVVVVSDEQEDKEPAEDKEPVEDKEPPKPAPKKPEPKKSEKNNKGKEYLPDFPYDFKTVLSVLLAVCAIVFIWCIIFHPAMRIESIEVNGNYEFTDEEIMDALGVHVGDHILTPTLMQCMSLERSTPYIDDVSVHISFPSSLVINVTERHKLAYIKVPDGYAVIDDEGVILEFCTFDADDVHPVLCGLDLDGVVIGQRTDITDSLKFQKMILVLGAVLDADRGSIRNDGYHFYDSVREVRIVSSGLIFLTVELPDGTVLQVKLAGVENIDENMQWLLYAIRADAFEGLPAGSLDMTEDEKIYRAYSTYY
jgi:cell division septal protein FtsQ